ncbi:MAG: type II toxin-antitoxin system Phd/YefM family antitoxin [Opitutaceae bacterium]|nr:type II toxin-antitoxin system Phd/YefM family antitoxin [Opitutaceae bacterium]
MDRSFSVNEIYSLSDFQRNAKKHIQRLKKNGRPEVLTVKGKAELVVINAAAFEAMQQDIDYKDGVEKIRAGLTQAAKGKLIPADQAFAEIRENLRIAAKGA